ncbi:MAG: UbiA family prenyltransferase [Candidatus Heimdallarchaeota archaeon]
MSEITTYQNHQFKFVKGFIGAFRLMHFLPVMTTTTIGVSVAILTLKGSDTFSVFFQNISNGTIPIAPLIFLVLTIFFQQAFLGIQNDYIDREIDSSYNKRKAINDGWVSARFAFWFGIVCLILFTGFSFAVGFWSITSFWGILFIQGANLIGVFYNVYTKHRPISIIPYMIGFPLIPTYVWITFGGFDVKYLWILPILVLVSFPAHIANELPDLEYDIKYGKRNFAVFLGKKLSTIIYWIGILLIEGILLAVFLLYNLNIWASMIIIGLSLLIGLGAFILLRKKNWETDLLVFNIVTMCIGVQVIGFFIMFWV